MSHITEHHSEEEWEGNDRDWHWVGFEVSWHTIGVNDQLEHSSEVGGLEVSWSWDCVVVIGHNFGSTVLGKSALDQILLLDWSPEIADEALVLPFHLIEGLVKGLFLGEEHLVDVNGGGGLSLISVSFSFDLIELDELVSEGLFGSIEDTTSIRNRLFDLQDLWLDLLEVWEFVSLS